MKTTKMILCALVALSTVFIGCKKEEVLTAKDIAGTYKGYTLTASQYFQDYFTADEQVVIEAVSEEVAKLTLTSETWGTTIVNNMNISFSGKTCSFSGSGSVEMAGMGGEAKKYDCTVSGTVDANKTANVTVNIPAVMGGSTIVFTTGTAPADYYIADRYQGSLVMSVMGKPYGEPADVTITLEASGKNSVTVKLPAVGEGRMALPALDIADVAVNTSDYNTFTLAETSFEQTVDSLHCTGTVKGSVVDGKLTLNYSVKPGDMPMNIDFVFTTKDAESKKILAKLEF
ncbi:MAG: hypothetical protein IJU33_04920 [Bacteroidales bacterium]|nr:hypothetical protein [Bacteroidales bacterium]